MILSALLFAVLFVSSSAQDFDLHTTDEWKYTYYPWRGPSLKFKVKATNDAHFIFAVSSDPDLGSNNQFVEIVIGGWSNGQSVIRKSRSDTANVVTQTPGVLSGEEFRGFWVKNIGDSGFMIGKESEEVPFMVFKDPRPIKITHYGLCTGFGSSGDWRVFDTKSKDESPCSPGDIRKVYSPFDGSLGHMVKQSCYDKLTEQCSVQSSEGEVIRNRIPEGKKSYIISKEMKTWDEARSACESKGQSLASIRSKDDQLLLEATINRFQGPFSGVWIGANDRAKYGHFVWQGVQDPVTYSNWESNKRPSRDDNSGRNCAFASYVSLVVRKSAVWFIQKCTNSWHYACETYDIK